MTLLSSSLLLRTHALTILTTSYFLLTAPLTLLQSTPIWILGEAMHIRPALFQPSLNPLTGAPIPLDDETAEVLSLVALTLSIYAISTLLFTNSLSVPSVLSSGRASHANAGSRARLGEEVHTLLSSQSSHLSLALTHVFGSGALVAWIYLFHSSRNLLGSSWSSSRVVPGSIGALVGNQVVFSAGLMDMLFWGYLWTVLREERREVLGKVQALREDED